MELNLPIGERLREERERMNKTQSEFAAIAEAVGVPGATRQSQARYEKGLQAPNAGYLAAVASAGVDVMYVLTGRRDGQVPVNLSPEEQLLLDAYRAMDGARQKGLLAFVLPGELQK